LRLATDERLEIAADEINNERPVMRWCCSDNAILTIRGIVNGNMGDQHESEKRNDRQGQISFWRMLNNKEYLGSVEQPAIGSQRVCEGLRDEGRIGQAEGRLAQW
jgi:hypothetical protein